MTEYILQTVMRYNKNEITCPSCGRNWPLNLVKHVACFNPDEWKDIESKIERLSLIKSCSHQQCPGCQMWLKKTVDSVEVVNCWNCTSKKGVKFNFCWKCLHETSAQTNECPKNCSTLRENKNILETCPMKTIGSEECPSVRSCPNCKLLIHHIDKCKHMTCKCGCEFCFVCLKFSPPGKPFNSHYNVPCDLASKQLHLI